MPASSGPISSPWLIISVTLQLPLTLALLSEAIQFEFQPSFTPTNLPNITFVEQIGWFKDIQSLLPLKVDTTLSITPNSSKKAKAGSGMAFFVSNFSRAPLGSNGGGLGLVPVVGNTTYRTGLKFFAVEFNTFRTPLMEDPSASHIGIDINSLISTNFTNTGPDSPSPFYPELDLYNNYTFKAWIEYDAVTSLIQVWMTNSSSAPARPPRACVQFTYDLSSVFEEYMHVGFTATNIATVFATEEHNLFSWSFSSDIPNATAIGSFNVTGSSPVQSTQRNPRTLTIFSLSLSSL